MRCSLNVQSHSKHEIIRATSDEFYFILQLAIIASVICVKRIQFESIVQHDAVLARAEDGCAAWRVVRIRADTVRTPTVMNI